MKKILFGACAALISALALTSCEVDLGLEPGNDTAPKATIFQYSVSSDYDADCDVSLRVAVNNQTTEAYVFSELASEKAARIASSGEEAYCDYVIKNGKKVNATVDTPADIVLEKVFGECAITVVAVNGSQKTATETTFTGVEWVDVATGTYTFAVGTIQKLMGAKSVPATLQYLSTDKTQYRFKNLFAKNKHLVFSYDGKTARVLGQTTPLSYGSYGTVSVRDVAAWQGDEGYAEWNDFALNDGYIEFALQWYVSAGSLGWNYDLFEVD